MCCISSGSIFFFSSRRRHTRFDCDWSSDVCSSDLGSECDWGKVLVFDPPGRLVLTWQLNAEFQYDPDLARASEVEVLFTEENGETRVDFEHRHIERHGAGADELARSVASDGGWPAILDLYAKAAAAA